MTFTLGYNPASQIVSRVISNNAYLFDYANQNTSYTNNGRNELTNAGGSSFTYDSNRNVTNDGARAYTYDAANRMLSAASTNFTYDPTGALYDIGSHRLASVGGERLALYTTSGGALHRRIVPGASFDEAAAYYHGSGTTTRQWPLTDQLGSVVAYANASGGAANINTYDEYGRPGSGNAEFLQYTGQLAIGSAPELYNYRNRFYQANVGRFLQTDPILYDAGLNLFAYVGNDPVNFVDPWGLTCWGVDEHIKYTPDGGVTITGIRICLWSMDPFGQLSISPTPPEPHDPTLEFETVQGGPTQCPWAISWRLSGPSKLGGVIIQEIRSTWTSASGAVRPAHFWEGGNPFWNVQPGGTRTSAYIAGFADDTFDVTTASGASPHGVLTVTATARFYEGQLKNPGSFGVGGAGNHPNSGTLSSSIKPPNLPGGSAPVVRTATCTFP